MPLTPGRSPSPKGREEKFWKLDVQGCSTLHIQFSGMEGRIKSNILKISEVCASGYTLQNHPQEVSVPKFKAMLTSVISILPINGLRPPGYRMSGSQICMPRAGLKIAHDGRREGVEAPRR